jgi:23S rRNA U2552 (ribose-2'-O)-methylase RlmE/FtsJ
LKSIEAFYNSPYSCHKLSSYFEVYDQLFTGFIGKPITFVEIGVANGGSLFMWREFFGPEARIIGIDLNPEVLIWKDYGFEIFIGNQSDKEFWNSFLEKVPQIDIVLDDGGHTFLQQITTVDLLIHAIKPGGLIVVEDTVTSYMSEFAPKSGSTFIDYAFSKVHGINYRYSRFNTPYENRIFSVQFFHSIVAFSINPEKCKLSNHILNNNLTIGYTSSDYRYGGKPTSSRPNRYRRIVNKLQDKARLLKIGRKLKHMLFITKRLIKNISDRKYYKKMIHFRHRSFKIL